MKKDFGCMSCKPADMPCDISKECKRQRRELKKNVNGYGVDEGHPKATPPKIETGVYNKTSYEPRIPEVIYRKMTKFLKKYCEDYEAAHGDICGYQAGNSFVFTEMFVMTMAESLMIAKLQIKHRQKTIEKLVEESSHE